MTIAERRAALLARVKTYGGPLNEPAVMAQFMAQVMHESGGLRFVREIWGPTKAQRGYEGRADLGNTRPGDGKRFMGRDVLQITGRANYRALTEWVRKTFGVKVDFEAQPELLESPEWLGIGAIWYFLTRKDLIRFCREGNIEMVTRRVNGGLNGYDDRLRWYDEGALKLLGFTTVATFQKSAGLVADGISGPKTRAAMHKALTGVRTPAIAQQLPPLRPAEPATAPKPLPAAPAPRNPASAPPAAWLAAFLAAGAAAWQWGADLIDWLTFWK
jgi:putative chitinase